MLSHGQESLAARRLVMFVMHGCPREGHSARNDASQTGIRHFLRIFSLFFFFPVFCVRVRNTANTTKLMRTTGNKKNRVWDIYLRKQRDDPLLPAASAL